MLVSVLRTRRCGTRQYQHRTHSTLPVIDAHALTGVGTDPSFQKTANEIGRSFREFGFVYLKHSRLTDPMVENAVKSVSHVLSTPAKEKLSTSSANPYGVYKYEGNFGRCEN